VFLFLSQLLFGWLLADLVSGILHFGQDKMGSENTPFFAGIITAGMSHHADPEKFINSPLWYRNRHNVAGAVLFFIIASLLWGAKPWIYAAALGGLLMIEIQVYAHRETNSRAIRFLQFTGIIQRPRQHAFHHSEDNRAYCAITSWLNPFLDKAGLWRWLHKITKRWHRKT